MAAGDDEAVWRCYNGCMASYHTAGGDAGTIIWICYIVFVLEPAFFFLLRPCDIFASIMLFFATTTRNMLIHDELPMTFLKIVIDHAGLSRSVMNLGAADWS